MTTGQGTFAALGVAVLTCTALWRAFPALENFLQRLANSRKLSILTAALLPLALRALLLPVMPPPVPQSHDEFSYLLAADTFSQGRLANPTPSLADHFESMHILVRPSYASIYPVAQGMFLAAGEKLLGTPWAGVWLSIGLMSGALCWMLQGWVSPGWALYGAVLAALRLGVFSYWMNSYWGGAVAALGGALVLGAIPRLRASQKGIWNGALLGIGLAILANSRPFEGLVFAVVLAAVGYGKVVFKPAVWPAVLILAVTAAGMLYYFRQVTGDPLMMPHVLYRETQASAPLFLWQQPRPQPEFHHQVLLDFSKWEVGEYFRMRSFHMTNIGGRAWTYWRFFFGWVLTVPLIALFWLWKDSDMRRLMLAAGLFFAAALSLQVWENPHYAAPATGLFFLILTLSLQRLQTWKFLVRILLPASALILLANSFHGDASAGSRWLPIQAHPKPARAAMLGRLEASGGKHLVVVRYQPQHNVHEEWVYNAADIDSAPVVWARDMGDEGNRDLLAYFSNRKIWLAEPDQNPPSLVPYPIAPAPAASVPHSPHP
jgi:hypothetical protein